MHPEGSIAYRAQQTHSALFMNSCLLRRAFLMTSASMAMFTTSIGRLAMLCRRLWQRPWVASCALLWSQKHLQTQLPCWQLRWQPFVELNYKLPETLANACSWNVGFWRGALLSLIMPLQTQCIAAGLKCHFPMEDRTDADNAANDLQFVKCPCPFCQSEDPLQSRMLQQLIPHCDKQVYDPQTFATS